AVRMLAEDIVCVLLDYRAPFEKAGDATPSIELDHEFVARRVTGSHHFAPGVVPELSSAGGSVGDLQPVAEQVVGAREQPPEVVPRLDHAPPRVWQVGHRHRRTAA